MSADVPELCLESGAQARGPPANQRFDFKRVIVSDGTRVAMGSGLAEALQVLFGQRSSTSEDATGTPEAAIPGAREAFSRADQALRQGDWSTFGREWEQLKNLLEK